MLLGACNRQIIDSSNKHRRALACAAFVKVSMPTKHVGLGQGLGCLCVTGPLQRLHQA